MRFTKKIQLNRERILAEIDAEIANLQKARTLLEGGSVRNISPEGRERISRAVSHRWQEYRSAKTSL
jgi:hypothetical protein